MEIDRLSSKIFSECLHTTFQIADSSAKIELVAVNEGVSSARQESFSLLFHGPASPFLTQRTYAMEHERLGKIELFLVPVGQNAKGYEYEAVFNRLRKDAK